jgi:hypothetical protein
MKNFMNFKEFSMNERYDWDSYYGDNSRETELGKKLQDISNKLRYSLRKTGPEELDSSAWLLKKGLSSLFNLGAKIADGKKGKNKSDDGEKKKLLNKEKEKIELEREWEEFVKDSERKGISKFGEDWSLLNPRTEEEKRYSETVRRREMEMIARMIK